MLSSRDVQRKVFEAQVENCINENERLVSLGQTTKPLFVHLREPDSVTYNSISDSNSDVPSALKDMIDLIQGLGKLNTLSNSEATTFTLKNVIVHCVTSHYSVIKQLIDSGIRLGFTGYIGISKRAEASGTISGIRQLSDTEFAEKIMIETDAPYMRPDRKLFPENLFKLLKKNRGGYNEAATLPITCKVLADLLDSQVDLVAKQTTQNSIQFFKLDKADELIASFSKK